MNTELHINYHAPLYKVGYTNDPIGDCTYYVMMVINEKGVQSFDFSIDNYDENSPTLTEFRNNPDEYYTKLKSMIKNKYK